MHIVTCESYDPLKARRCVQSGVDLGIGVHVPSFNLGNVGGGTVEGNDFSQKQCYEQVLQVDSHHAAAKAAFDLSSSLREAAAKASLLEEEAAEETKKKATKKKKARQKVNKKAPTTVPAEELPKKLVSEVDPSRHTCEDSQRSRQSSTGGPRPRRRS